MAERKEHRHRQALLSTKFIKKTRKKKKKKPKSPEERMRKELKH